VIFQTTNITFHQNKKRANNVFVEVEAKCQQTINRLCTTNGGNVPIVLLAVP
jgi:hypothetical protein